VKAHVKLIQRETRRREKKTAGYSEDKRAHNRNSSSRPASRDTQDEHADAEKKEKSNWDKGPGRETTSMVVLRRRDGMAVKQRPIDKDFLGQDGRSGVSRHCQHLPSDSDMRALSLDTNGSNGGGGGGAVGNKNSGMVVRKPARYGNKHVPSDRDIRALSLNNARR